MPSGQTQRDLTPAAQRKQARHPERAPAGRHRHEHVRPAASVQPTGSECCLPSASRKNTRSSAQVWPDCHEHELPAPTRVERVGHPHDSLRSSGIGRS